jgi:hypothetical protein
MVAEGFTRARASARKAMTLDLRENEPVALAGAP